MAEQQGKIAWIPAAIGFLLGIVFLLTLDSVIPHMHLESDKPEGVKSKLKKTTMMVFAVTLHNIPEGMAVGVTFAGALMGNSGITMAGAFTLALRNSHSKLSRRSHYLNAYARSRQQSVEIICVRISQWSRRANRSHRRSVARIAPDASPSIHARLCCRRHVLRSSGRADTRSLKRAAQQPQHYRFRHRLRTDDGA